MTTNLWHNFRFTRLLASMTIGNLGDWFDVFALQIIAVQEFNASPLFMGLLVFFYFIPAIIFAPYAGAIADRYSKRNIMIIIDILSAVLTLGILLSYDIFTVSLLVLIRSSIASFNSPTQQAYIKHIVPDKQLLQASGYTTISFSLSKIFGPILGAIILLFTSARFCLGINVISFIVSFLILFTLPTDKPITTLAVRGRGNIAVWFNDVKEGARFMWRNTLLRGAMFIALIWFFCSMVYMAQLTIFLKSILPQKTNILGYMMGLEGAGAVFFGAILSRRKKFTNYAGYFFAAFFCISVGVLGVAFYQVVWPLFFLYVAPLIRGIGSGIGGVTYNYLIRKESTERQIGCVSGISSAIQNFSLAVGTLVSGVLVVEFGTRATYIGLAAIMFLLGLGALLLKRR